MAQINGYGKMFEELKTGLDSMNDKAGKKINSADDNDSIAFINEMASEMIKGISMMSKPAVVVMVILAKYGYQLSEEYAEEHEALLTELSNEGKKIRKGAENDECPAYNAKISAFLGYANPRIRAFHEKHLEKFRTFLNTTCTWVWYLAGNPKDLSMYHCISWTQAFVGFYEEAVSDLNVEWPGCANHQGDGVAAIALPKIPDFTCPTIVRVPFGNHWQQLSNSVKNFDDNSSGIKQNANVPIPNSSIAYGAGLNGIAEAGRDPFSKTANGSVTAGMVNDDELAPLAKIKSDEDELAPIVKIKSDEDELAPIVKIQPEELTPLPFLDELEHRRKSKLAKELLTKLMTADCKNVKDSKDILKEQIERMLKGVKELEAYEHVIEQIKKLESEIEQKETDQIISDLLKKQIEKMQQETEKMHKYEQVQQSKNEIEKIIKEMDAMDEKKFMKEKFEKIRQAVEEMEAAPATLEDIQQNGLKPTISSGIQAPGTFTPVKGLFN
jgi:hypothetical protein